MSFRQNLCQKRKRKKGKLDNRTYAGYPVDGMQMDVYINQNGILEHAKMEDVRLSPDNSSFTCTAYAYGNSLAEVLKKYLEARAEAEVEVLSDEGDSIHRLKILSVNGEYTVTERAEGTHKPTVAFVKRTEKIPERYLIQVDARNNRNEFYKMTDLGGGEWGATHGRIGEKQSRSRMTRNVVIPKSYPDYMFGVKLQEKLSKGYQDKSECHEVKVLKKNISDPFTTGINNPQIADLVGKLISYAQNVIGQNYTVSYTDVTKVMVRDAAAEIENMRKSADTEEFNWHLISLMHVIPRKIDRKSGGVNAMLAESKKDFAAILIRETELLDVMESQIGITESERQPEESILQKMGLEIFEASNEQICEVKKQLNSSLVPRLKRVFCVTNLKTEKSFNEYIKRDKTSDGKQMDTRLFWHGSRNANWLSILQKGLLLNPDAVITGKMFGNGVYFALSAMKSWGYTSSRNAKWNSESSNLAYLSLYETAYGKPYEVYSYDGNWSGFSYSRLQNEHPGCSCVHAKKERGMLYDDEIIFYREDQMTIRYICEFSAA